MPREGRKTIDLPANLVDKYKKIVKDNKANLNLIGVTSLQGFLSKLLNGLLEEGVVPKDLEKYLPL